VADRDAAEAVVRSLREAGHAAYFAGGCVRDLLMGRPPEDYDIATDAPPDKVLSLFPGSVAVGAAFGVVRVKAGADEFEVATFRADGPTADGRRPVSVRFCSAEEDVRRRDFTVNGMLYDPLDDRVLDWVGGRRDIACKVIRTIGDPRERFAEDRLRMLRAVRFASDLDFAIESDTYEAIRAAAERLTQISAERIRDELFKILTLPGARPARGVRLLLDTGLLEAILPEVARMAGVEQPARFHPEGDVFEHTCLMLETLRRRSPELALAVLLHDVGKPLTQTFEERIRFDEHDRVGAEVARDICARLRLSKNQTDNVVALVSQHMRIASARSMRPAKLKRLLADPRFEDHLELHRADCLASHAKLDVYEFLLRKRAEWSAQEISPPPLVNGKDLIALGLQPGPLFSRILQDVRDRQLDGELRTRDEALAYVQRAYAGPQR